MKIYSKIGLVAAFLLPSAGFSQEVYMESKVKAVTVFLSGAQIERQGQVKLALGNNEIVVSGLPQQMDPNSVQVEGSADYTILSVNHRMNYLDKVEPPKDVKAAQDSVDAITVRVRRLEDQKAVLALEKEMILKNKIVKGSVEGFDVDALIELADFYRNRLRLIELGLIGYDRRAAILNKELGRYQRQLSAWRARGQEPTSEIVVKVSARAAKLCDLKVSYLAFQCGWTPAYDVRAEDVKGPIQLVYKGNVWQRTGENWEDVMLTLSTGNPTLSGTQPTVQPWILQFYVQAAKKSKGYANAYDGAPAPAAQSNTAFDMGSGEEVSGAEAFDPMPGSTAELTEIVSAGVNNEFAIKLPYSVISGEEAVSAEIQKISLNAIYRHVAVPKLDRDAFLTARVTDWRSYSLLPGTASIYYQGTYVGSSYMDTRITKDTLDMSLGRDRGINIQRKLVSEFRSSKVIGSTRQQSSGFEIQIRNTQKYSVTMDVYDHIPVSLDKSVEVTLDDAGGAKVGENNGKLTWTVVLGPGEQKSLRFKYTVKYPKDKVIPNL